MNVCYDVRYDKIATQTGLKQSAKRNYFTIKSLPGSTYPFLFIHVRTVLDYKRIIIYLDHPFDMHIITKRFLIFYFSKKCTVCLVKDVT